MKAPIFPVIAALLIYSNIVPLQKVKYTSVQNDEFTSDLLDRASYEKLAKTSYIVTKKSSKISGVQEVTFSNGGNKLVYYKSKYNVFPKYMVFVSQDKIINNLVAVGMPKLEVMNKLRLNNSLDILKISDLEGGAITTLYFSNNKLQKIIFNATVD